MAFFHKTIRCFPSQDAMLWKEPHLKIVDCIPGGTV